MGRTGKRYEELTITDDFMFGKVMRNPKHCKKLLEIILDVNIREIAFIDDQQTLNPDYRAKSIRIDVYVEDDADTVYTVEMQVRNTGELPVRSRYYQSVVDVNLIEKGSDYEQLKKNYVIFICSFDLFGRGRHIYHFENLCREDPTVRLQDAFTGELEEAVAVARVHKEWRQEYMKLELMMMDSRREGRREGRTEGEIKKLVDLVCRKLTKGKTPEAIADDLEESASEVRRICDAAAKYAPDYDTEKILQELLAMDFF